MNAKIKLIAILIIIILYGCKQPQIHNSDTIEVVQPPISDWKSQVADKLKIFGHRNWIVIADAAYPKQSNPAIETLAIDADQLEAVQFVADLIEKAKYVDANMFVDKEMAFVDENNAEGIGAYRDSLHKILNGKPVRSILHEDIIKELDASAKLFNVLILKTDTTIPYTSVFFQLECGYWNAESEKELRRTMEEGVQK